jgi:hypothetical protein
MNRSDYVLRYLAHGQRVHILGLIGVTVGEYSPAYCGIGPDWRGEWFGTGTQNEYETAAELSVCARCLIRVRS